MKKVHLPKPISAGGSPSLFDDPILWCGRTGDYKTPHTSFRRLATCSRCLELDLLYEEELEYQKMKARRSAEQT